jgi:hypothetical protein
MAELSMASGIDGILRVRPVDLLSESQIFLVAGAADQPLGVAFLTGARAFADGQFARALRDPKINSERVLDDFRTQYGLFVGLHFCGALVQACKEVTRGQ